MRNSKCDCYGVMFTAYLSFVQGVNFFIIAVWYYIHPVLKIMRNYKEINETILTRQASFNFIFVFKAIFVRKGISEQSGFIVYISVMNTKLDNNISS